MVRIAFHNLIIIIQPNTFIYIDPEKDSVLRRVRRLFGE